MFRRRDPKPASVEVERLKVHIIRADQAVRSLTSLPSEVVQARSLPSTLAEIRSHYLYMNMTSTHLEDVVMFNTVRGSAKLLSTVSPGERDHEPRLVRGIVNDTVDGFLPGTDFDVTYDGFSEICTNPEAFSTYISIGTLARSLFVNQDLG